MDSKKTLWEFQNGKLGQYSHSGLILTWCNEIRYDKIRNCGVIQSSTSCFLSSLIRYYSSSGNARTDGAITNQNIFFLSKNVKKIAKCFMLCACSTSPPLNLIAYLVSSWVIFRSSSGNPAWRASPISTARWHSFEKATAWKLVWPVFLRLTRRPRARSPEPQKLWYSLSTSSAKQMRGTKKNMRI